MTPIIICWIVATWIALLCMTVSTLFSVADWPKPYRALVAVVMLALFISATVSAVMGIVTQVKP